ncbi:LysR substrate-binding domain-containing protein [Photobacterium sp. S4TG1]|uniref:LysR substrate-binding domain-containing protein n=1 Tax=Photobacterium sp. S4TG1 TaxID=3114587 RepID=UPI002E190A53|nr:LysR substrate-binding domain-containing protein [Photobacterium sp. S4TG1]
MKNFDINLLRILNVLLEEKSVTATAARLHLSQSAVSKQLAKLRQTFADPLFERTPYGLRPTPKALSLSDSVSDILQQINQLTRAELFDPALSQRQFHIDLVETAYSLTYPRFMPQMLQQAPDISLTSQTWNDDSLQRLLRCEIDFGIGIFEWDERSASHYRNVPSSLNYIELARDYPVCLMRKGHPALTKPWNLDAFLRYRHLQVSIGGLKRWLLDEILALENKQLDNAVNMTDFYAAAKLCEQSDLFMCYPSGPALAMIENTDLVIRPIPIELEPGGYLLLWNKHFDLDPSHQWLRKLITNGVNTSLQK